MYYCNEKVKNLDRIFDQNSRKEYIRLDLNENPGGLPEEFIEDVMKEVTPRLISEYPETLEFTEVLADYLDTDISKLCLVNGSSEGIRYVIQAFTSEGGKILGVTPTYAMFEVYAKMFGREFIAVNYPETLEMNIDSILDKMNAEIQLLILVNPNNPMGNTYTEDEFIRILRKAEECEITILIDEAYHYFYPDTFIKYALNKEHIFVTRTFSKLFSLAGLRLGYVAGWTEGIKMVQKLCTPHNVNAIAELFAQRLLENKELVQQLIQKHKEGREYLITELSENGYEYKGEAGNFIFIKCKKDADYVVEKMKKQFGILIKSYNGIGNLGKCLRVTTAERLYMKKFVEALLIIDNGAN